MGFAKRHRIPLVVSLHGRDVTILMGADKYKPAWWPYLLRHRRLFRQAALFSAASTELRDLITDLGCPAHKVVVHRLGIDLSAFTPDPSLREKDPPLIAMVGRFVAKKGHRYGIEAAARARDAGHRFKLVIVGDGPLASSYRSLVDRLGLAQMVSLPGPLAPAEVIDLLRRATVSMAPSVVAKNLDRESGIIVVKEASACGVPVIGTRHGGIPDIVDHDETGFLVGERDADDLGRRLISLLEDTALRERMGLAARRKMEREYDIRDRIRALEDLYDDVIAGRLP